MCMYCEPLLKAIDTYLEKANEDLAGKLEDEGYIEPEETVEIINTLEDGVAGILIEETDYVLDAVGKVDGLVDFSEVWEEIKDDDKTDERLYSVFRELFRKFMPKFASYYLADLDDGLEVSELSEGVVEWVESWSRNLADLMKLNSHVEIEKILKKGLEEGKGIESYRLDIVNSGIRNEHYKARRVAVTEVLTAHRVAQQEAFMQSPSVTEKTWKHTGFYIRAPRKNHIAMNGQRVPKGDPFILSGEDGGIYYPMYPGDISLPPEERINCHCISQPVVDESILGLSLEERRQLQQQAVDEMDADWRNKAETANQDKVGFKPAPYRVNMTERYFENAAQGEGKIIYSDGYNRGKHAQEISMAEYLHSTFGGNVELLNESPNVGEKTPDYNWNGKLWELKTITTEKAADSALRSAFKQIQANAGGVILDCGDNDISKTALNKVVMGRFRRTNVGSADIMILRNGKEDVKVYRYKK